MNFRKSMYSAILFLVPFLTVSGELTGTVVQVHDGDTLVLKNGDNYTKIRLYGIDCPELKQEMGEDAKIFTVSLCLGKDVKVQTGKSKDKYKREIGIVVTDKKNLNIELLKAGMAWHYKYYSKDKDYADAEQEAIRQKLGIWKNHVPQAPWEYRHAKRKHAVIPADASRFLCFSE